MSEWSRSDEGLYRSELYSGGSVFLAVIVNVAALGLIGLVSLCDFNLFKPHEPEPEKIDDKDLTVIINENLDGDENEPPPTMNPPEPLPEPPKPPKPPKPPEQKTVKPPEPRPLDQIVTNIVARVDKKEESKVKDKPKEDKKPEKKESQEERIKRIRGAVVTNKDKVKIQVKTPVSGNGRTGRQNMTEAEIRQRLGEGYRPGTSNNIAKNEDERCKKLIKMAIDDKWNEVLPPMGRSGTVVLSITLNADGGVQRVSLVTPSGDALTDQAALKVTRAVTSVRGMSSAFIRVHKTEPIKINYRVMER